MSVNIIHTETVLLTEGEYRVLKVKRNKRFLMLLSTYVVLILIFIYGLGPRYWLAKQGISPRGPRNSSLDPELVVKVAPPLFIFLVLVISYFIVRDFLRTVYKLQKDINGTKKQLVSFIPSKVPMPYFKRYFLNTPFNIKPQIEISEKTFFSIADNNYLVAEIAPSSEYIFSILLNNEIIEFK
jgi:hypothetical protein